MRCLNQSVINQIDDFFTDLFARWQDFISLRSFGILLVGIIIGFAICASMYSILFIKSITQDEYAIQKATIDDEKINQLIERIKQEYIDKSEGLKIKNRFEVLGTTLLQTIEEIASFYYPNSNYPIYELTFEEAALLLHHLSNRLNVILDKPTIRLFKKISIKKIFEILDKKKQIEENKLVKVAKKAHLGKIKSIVMGVVKAINPFYWGKKLINRTALDYAVRKLALIAIEVTAEETNNAYSKKIFDRERNLRDAELDKMFEDLEREEVSVYEG